MQTNRHHKNKWPSLKITLQWCGLCLGPAILSAIATLLLMQLVDKTQTFRSAHPLLFLLLPIGAVGIYLFQRRYPQKALPFTLQNLHQVPAASSRYALPFLYISTALTHLFGGSAGREGPSFQTAATIGEQFANWYGPNAPPKRIIAASAIAAAFAVLFGTPMAAAIFALELTRIERFPAKSLVPSIVGACTGLGIGMVAGPTPSQFKYLFSVTLPVSSDGAFHADLRLFIVALVLGILMGALSCAFTEASIQLRYVASWIIQPRWVAPIFASAMLAVFAFFTPAANYMGLGILPTTPQDMSILAAFQPASIPAYAWLIKLALTLLTLTAGFRGGELVPLLVIATLLAHSLCPLAGIPTPVFCAMAFVAIFAAAANTPIAAILLSAELFGGQYLVYATFCILIAYFLSPPTRSLGTPHRHGIPKLFVPEAFASYTTTTDTDHSV